MTSGHKSSGTSLNEVGTAVKAPQQTQAWHLRRSQDSSNISQKTKVWDRFRQSVLKRKTKHNKVVSGDLCANEISGL